MRPTSCNFSPCSRKTKYPNSLCKRHGGTYFCTYDTCNLPINKHKTRLCDTHCKCDKCTNLSSTKVSIPPAHPKCSVSNCLNTIALRSTTGKCKRHNKSCPNCIEWIDARIGNKKYDGYCATCFKRCFPDDERSSAIRSDSAECKVRDFINQHFQGFVHNKPIYTHHCDCTNRRRIDHYLLLGNTVLAIETDEHQHITYSDEEVRYNDLYMHFSGKWIFIRFNVHSFHDNKGRFRQTKFPNRLTRLKDEIQKSIDRILAGDNFEMLEIIKLFYDDFTYPRYKYTYSDGAYVKTLLQD